MRRSPPQHLFKLMHSCPSGAHLGMYYTQRKASPTNGGVIGLTRKCHFEWGQRSAGVGCFHSNHGSTPLQHLPVMQTTHSRRLACKGQPVVRPANLPARPGGGGASAPSPLWPEPCNGNRSASANRSSIRYA